MTEQPLPQPSNVILLAGRYSVDISPEARLGSGGMGEVFRGKDEQTGEGVAVKVLNADLTSDPSAIERFIREGEALRKLRHGNIVQMLDAVELDGRRYLIMELVSAGSLRSELEPHGASAGVAYFGYVETDLIGQVFDNELADRFREEIAPSFLTKKMPVSQVAEALIDGTIRREPRIIEPAAWRPPLYLRGQVGPLNDRQLERNPKVGDFIREFERRDIGASAAPLFAPVRSASLTTWPARSCWSRVGPRASVSRSPARPTVGARRLPCWIWMRRMPKPLPARSAPGRSVSPRM